MVNEISKNKFSMKKEEFKHFIGIDISKSTLDLALVNATNQEVPTCIEVTNDAKGMKQIAQWIRSLQLEFDSVLFCLEHTGIYGLPVLNFLTKKGAFVWVEMAIQIIKSSGIQRGKNDKVDAKRIAQYAYRYQDNRKSFSLPSENQTAINDLMSTRDRLIAARNMLVVPAREFDSVHEYNRSKRILKSGHHTLKGLEKDISEIERQVEELVKKDEAVNKNVALVTSIPGIGKWTALALILATNNFNRKMTSRQLACYCGCAPFEHRSGSSVRGKTRVSHMANKNLKKLLTLCASSILRSQNEMAEYYCRKVAEGKNKMSVINAIRNKLVHRICAVIDRQSPYLPTVTHC
jgi:transposase